MVRCHQELKKSKARTSTSRSAAPLPRGKVIGAIAILLSLIFSKYFYMVSLSSYYTFYLIERFQVSVWSAQVHLFVFLAAVAVRTFAGGPIGDRIGRKVRHLVLHPRHPAIHAAAAACQPVLDGRAERADRPDSGVGVLRDPRPRAGPRAGQDRISGLFFGFSFGMGGLGAAVLGHLADGTSIEFVYRVCAYLPLMGVLAAFLPKLETHHT